MFTTCPLPAGVQMFSVMKCHQLTRIAVERASGYHVFVQSRGRSLRAVASAGRRWSSSVVTSFSWRSGIVELTQSSTPHSSSLRHHICYQGSHGQPCAWSSEHLDESCVSSGAIGVCAGWMCASERTRQLKGSRSRSVKDAVSWPRMPVAFRSGHGSALHRAWCRFGVFKFGRD